MKNGQHIVTVDCRFIRDYPSFHSVFAAAFGFPAFYGRNLDAWIDCMSNLDSDFSRVRTNSGGVVVLQLLNAEDLRARLPDLFSALLDCAAFVNARRLEKNESAILALAWE